MNERIQELALKASDPKTGWLDRQTFAKLIVQECIECLNPLSRNHSMVGAAQNTIKKHFGVEE